jgi:hypothetical protein
MVTLHNGPAVWHMVFQTVLAEGILFDLLDFAECQFLLAARTMGIAQHISLIKRDFHFLLRGFFAALVEMILFDLFLSRDKQRRLGCSRSAPVFAALGAQLRDQDHGFMLSRRKSSQKDRQTPARALGKRGHRFVFGQEERLRFLLRFV